MSWFQYRFALPAFSRGVHLVTHHVLRAAVDLPKIETGLMHVFIQHTSASLTINENADPDVRTDMEMSLNRLAPENAPYVHTLEGPDDMPAHVKASLMGSSVSIPISRGKLLLGTWQGIYLCEHRDRGGPRSLVVTLQGE
jgi:secondary thiamine-phosphate synthase enzyme